MKFARVLGSLLVLLVAYGLWCGKAWTKPPGVSYSLGFPEPGKKPVAEWNKTQDVFGRPPFSISAFLKAPWRKPQPVTARSIHTGQYRSVYLTHPDKPELAVEFFWSDAGGYQAPREVPLKELWAIELEGIMPTGENQIKIPPGN